MKLLERFRRDWAYTLSTPEIWLERFMAVLCLPRLIWLLPIHQAQFSDSVAAFTNYFPQWVWALWSLSCAIVLWSASNGVFKVKSRLFAAHYLGIHWLVIATLNLIGEPRAPYGWLYLLACSGPLVVIVYLSAHRAEAAR